MKIAYIAGPYSAPTESGIYDNIEAARKCAIRYWQKGYAVICPHTNSMHMGGIFGDDPDDNWQGFLNGDLRIIEVVDTVVMLPGWRRSQGAKVEHDKADELGKEILYENAEEPTLDDLVSKITPENLHLEWNCSCGCKEEVRRISGYAHAEIRCWCGEELAVEGGAPDFVGDGDWTGVTESYSCPIHGECWHKPRGIGISGKARSGKDTCAAILSAELGWPVTHLADALKREWFSWAYPERYALNDTDDIVETVDQMKNADPAIRQQLIEYGQHKREADPAYWIKTLNLDIPQIIADVRFQNEMDTLQAAGFYIIRLHAEPEVLTARGCPPIDDISEADLDDRTDWDTVIINNGVLGGLKATVGILAQQIGGGMGRV